MKRGGGGKLRGKDRIERNAGGGPCLGQRKGPWPIGMHLMAPKQGNCGDETSVYDLCC